MPIALLELRVLYKQ